MREPFHLQVLIPNLDRRRALDCLHLDRLLLPELNQVLTKTFNYAPVAVGIVLTLPSGSGPSVLASGLRALSSRLQVCSHSTVCALVV